MVKIEDNNITLTRGDTVRFLLEIFDCDGLPYNLKSTDQLIFTLRRMYGKGEELIRKTFTLPEFSLSTADTKDLSFGKYKYDIYLYNTQSHKLDTFIAERDFIISEEVHDFE